MKMIFVALSLLLGSSAFAGSAYEVRCDVGNKILFADHYLVIGGNHGDFGGWLRNIRIYDVAQDIHVSEPILSTQEVLNAGRQTVEILVKSANATIYAVAPNLQSRISGSHNGFAAVNVNIGGYQIQSEKLACSVFLN